MKKSYHQQKKNKLLIIFVSVLLILAITAIFFGGRIYNFLLQKRADLVNREVDSDNFFKPQVPTTIITPPSDENNSILPPNALITIAFTSQAPFAVWDSFHEESCEEVSFLMVKHYLDKTPLGSAADVDAELHSMVDYEIANGYGPSITIEELNKIAQDRYNLTGQVKTATVKNIETDVAAGHPVIIPAAGKLLGNPNFVNGGPNYHMLVVKGYDSSHFITNDPGTRKGNGYVYTQEVFMNAIHNWSPSDIISGAKVYLVF